MFLVRIVKPKSQNGLWVNQAFNRTLVDFKKEMQLTVADFFFQSFCGAHFEKAGKYGLGLGFVDDVWLVSEEWDIQKMFGKENKKVYTNDTMGLASLVVDIANETAYKVAALGQTGYEKLLPINPKLKGYVVIVLSGYNHEVEPSPLRIYVGKKGVDASGKKLSKRANGKDKFLGSNGLLYGKIYGLALKNSDFAKLGISKIDTSDKMMDTYLQNKDAPDTFKAIFFPTSYQWKGFDKPVAIKDTQMLLWSKASEQPKDFTYFVGDFKAEHSAVDPDVDKQRFVQNMTYSGAILAFDLTNFTEEIKEANGDLPKSVAVDVTRIVGAYDGSLRLEVGRRGRTIEGSTAAVWKDGKAKTTAPDGLQWIKASDADVLIVDEDSGNELGERKFALLIDPKTLKLKRPNQGYFLAMAGGKKNPRAAAKASAYGGTFSKATSAEFSGSWDISALVAKKPNGKFYTINELHGVGEYMIQKSLPLSQHTMLSVVQSKGESRGVLAKYQADQGGQIFIFNLNIPVH